MKAWYDAVGGQAHRQVSQKGREKEGIKREREKERERQRREGFKRDREGESKKRDFQRR